MYKYIVDIIKKVVELDVPVYSNDTEVSYTGRKLLIVNFSYSLKNEYFKTGLIIILFLLYK